MSAYKRAFSLAPLLLVTLLSVLTSCATTSHPGRGNVDRQVNSDNHYGKFKFSEGNRMRRTGAYSSANRWN